MSVDDPLRGLTLPALRCILSLPLTRDRRRSAVAEMKLEPTMAKIDIEDVLHGNPAWSDVVEFFVEGEWFEECYHTQAAKRWLLTPEQKQTLDGHGLSIGDCMRGNYGDAEESDVRAIYDEWNAKLDQHVYGH